MLTPNEVAIAFYEAFSRKNAEGMAALYGPNAAFHDPVFGNLAAQDTKDMWRMLCARSKDIRIVYRVTESSASSATVAWDAYYTFVKTGKPVVNRVRAHLHVSNGFITKHDDDFNFWRWAAQAFGPTGLLLGWTSFFRAKVRAEAAKSLASFKNKQALP